MKPFASIPPTPLLALAVAALVLPGCRLVQKTAEVPAKAVSAVVPGKKPTQLDPAELQKQLMRLSDSYSTAVAAALDEYARAVGTREGKVEALTWKLGSVSSVVSIASGPNPMEGLVDMTALFALSRRIMEQSAERGGSGAAFGPWLASMRQQETNAWRLAEQTLTSAELEELRGTLGQWINRHQEGGLTLFARPTEVVRLLKEGERGEGGVGGVFGWLGMDPLGGLDPAVREVTATRLFAERMLFTVQRMPFLIRWQTDLLLANLADMPETRDVLTSVDRIGESADRLSRVAEALPGQITEERRQIIADLENQEGRLRELSVQVGQTLAAGERMSTSLNATLITFDALMKRFGVGEPKHAGAVNTNKAPFNILDYAKTAEAMAATAAQLDSLLKDVGSTLDSPAWNSRLQDFDGMARRARADAEAVIDRVTWRVALLIAVGLVAALVYRWVGRRGA